MSPDEGDQRLVQGLIFEMLQLFYQAGYDDFRGVSLVVAFDGTTMVFEVDGVDDEARRVLTGIVRVVMREHGIEAYGGVG